MSLVRKEQSVSEPADKCGFENGDFAFVDPAVAGGPGGESLEFVLIACRCEDEGPVAHHLARQDRLPSVGGIEAALEHGLIGAFPFAPRGQHTAGEP